jgi:hypothetical protein
VNRFTASLLATFAGSVACAPLAAQATITPVAGFGAGGWLAPGAIPQLDTSNGQRGLAVNPATGNLILVDRDGTLGNNAWVIDGATGTVLGSLVPPAGGYSGGTFVVNIPGCGSDGSIHVCNLVTSTASTYKVYSWVSEADGLVNPATTNVSAAGASGSWGGMNRIGDCFTVTGGGASPVQFVSAGSNSAAGTNSAFLQGLLDGSGTVTPYTNVPGTVTSSNGYRLGLTYVDDDTFIGTQGTTAYVTSFDGTSATLDASIATGAAQRPMAYAVISGIPVLATVDSNSSTVFVYDITDPSAPALLVSGNATTGTLSPNVNGTGGCGWGAINGDTGTLYAMSSNQGIQAFTVTVPPVPQPQVVIPQGMDPNYTGNTGLTWRNSAFRYQMLYAPAHFLNQGIDYPITITRLQFRAINGATSAGGETYVGTTIAMSSSPSSYAAPSTTFANNIGADVVTVYSGDVVCSAASGSTPNDWVIDITLQTPFVYDPTGGLDLCLDVTAPNAPSPTGVPNMAASSSFTRDLARRVSTASPGSATGSASSFASVIKMDYIAPGDLAAATPYGAGCNDTALSFYENLGVQNWDLSGTAGSPNSFRMTPTGTGYSVTPGSNGWFTPASADLALTDDSLSAVQPLGFTFPYPGGSTTDIKVCSNGFVWLDTTQTAATFAGTPARLLGEAPRLAPLWHDMNPASGGTVHFDVDPSGTAAYATWLNVPRFGSTTEFTTCQVALFADGSAEFRYEACDVGPGIVGFSLGGGANDPGNFDLSADIPFTTEADQFPLTLANVNRPKINATFNVEVRNIVATAGVAGINFGLIQQTPAVDLAFIGAPTCELLTGIALSMPLTVTGSTEAVAFAIPNDPTMNGAHLYSQAFTFATGVNQGGIVLSNGLDLLFGLN